MARVKQRKSGRIDLSVFVQARISRAAKGLLVEKLGREALNESAYVRRLIYRDLAVIPEGEE